jgi:hypothetical protein
VLPAEGRVHGICCAERVRHIHYVAVIFRVAASFSPLFSWAVESHSPHCSGASLASRIMDEVHKVQIGEAEEASIASTLLSLTLLQTDKPE